MDDFQGRLNAIFQRIGGAVDDAGRAQLAVHARSDLLWLVAQLEDLRRGLTPERLARAHYEAFAKQQPMVASQVPTGDLPAPMRAQLVRLAEEAQGRPSVPWPELPAEQRAVLVQTAREALQQLGVTGRTPDGARGSRGA